MMLVNVLALFNLVSLSRFDIGFNYTRGYIGSNTYHYLLCKPSGEPIGTIFLLHGFPDLSYGWRYQIPTLTSLGFQVIAPDMLGCGRSSAPVALTKFSLKSMSNDLATLINRIVPGEQVILGGHDWGGAMVYRTALWHPGLFKGIFSVCTPYFPPTTRYVDLADQIAAGINPTFGYQLQLRNSTYDLYFNAPHRIRQILTAFYGGRTPDGELGFDSRTGLIFENLPYLQPSPLIGDADMNYYVAQYFKNRMRGPMSWYRTAEINFNDELPLACEEAVNFSMPGLYIGATQDTALPPEMSAGMEKYFHPGLTRGTVVSSHWALWHASQNVSKLIGDWCGTLT
ncbi:epoxide hydrolase [Ilyonectria sp. MPI-CAGE-AT-0026]|nr:epoxide hydrolase [Ilyonectria sp. MPI-CAGE-AT-0026]